MKDGAEKQNEKENPLKRIKSRELRGGVMYYSCHCIKRNGLQHDCRRSGCGGEPPCLVLPDPLCLPSQLARARGLADPAPLAAHMNTQGTSSSGMPAKSGSESGKKFIVCELKAIVPETSADKSGKCCKCSVKFTIPNQNGLSKSLSVNTYSSEKTAPKPQSDEAHSLECPCANKSKSFSSGPSAMFTFDEKTIQMILKTFDKKELAHNDIDLKSRPRKLSSKEEPCTRPGCVHWQPPPPCVWDAPCKADCFETPPEIQPGRNPVTTIGGSIAIGSQRQSSYQREHKTKERIKLLTPKCCTGCSAPSASDAPRDGSPAAGMPLLVMKLC